MVAEVFAGVGAFSAMLNAAKTLREMDNAAARNTAVIELQGQILSAQEEYSALLQSKRELEAKLAKFENWETEKERYELKEVKGFRSGLAYALKEGVEPSEPPHHICPDCYQGRKKSILQQFWESGAGGLMCQQCDWKVWLQGHPPAGSSTRRGGRR